MRRCPQRVKDEGKAMHDVADQPADQDGDTATWLPDLTTSPGPLYMAIADAIADAIVNGRLSPGDRLPPQRVLARCLGIDFTTVSRAYAEARRRALVDGKVGQGTFVRPPAPVNRPPPLPAPPPAPWLAGPSATPAPLDMSMNMPPRLADPLLEARAWGDIGALAEERGLDLLTRYQAPGGDMRDRQAGARWLERRLPGLTGDRVLLCAGAQGGLSAVLSVLTAPDDLICAEALTYPGLLSLAAHSRLRVAGLPMDAQGLLPDVFEAQCRRAPPRLLYCNPTLSNPTATTLPLDRRLALLEIARRHGVAVLEDEANGALPSDAPPPLAALAPDLVYHVATVSKCLSPALRVAYLVVPEGRAGARLTGAIRAVSTMVAPLTAAVASRWIATGTADALLAAQRVENRARHALAMALLPPGLARGHPDGFHLWLELPPPWTRGELVQRLRGAGVSVVASDAFAAPAATPAATPPEAVRLGLGVPATRAALRTALLTVADVLAADPARSALVV